MGKPAALRRLGENEALARFLGLRTSARKLNLVARTIRGMVEEMDGEGRLTIQAKRPARRSRQRHAELV